MAWLGDFYSKALGNESPMDSQMFGSDWGPLRSVVKWVKSGLSEIGTGLQNWWYSNTGRSYLTPDYQHQEELENTAYQRAAEDMTKSGLSKYGGLSGASSPSPSQGAGLLSTAMALQQLKRASLGYAEELYNFNKAKDWGVPTTSVGQFAKYDALAKVLFGKSLSDIVGDGGVIGAFFPDSADPVSDSEGSPTPNSINQGAYTDMAERALSAVARLRGVPTAPSLIKPSLSLDIPTKESGAPDLNSDQFELENRIIKSYRDSFYDEIGLIARGQPQGLSMNKFASKYVTELMKEGIMDKTHAIGLVRSWLLKDMDELGYSFDEHDKLWYYDH